MKKKFKILVAVPYPSTQLIKKILEDIADIDEKPLNQGELEEEIKKDNYDVLICWEFSQRITREMILSASPRFKIIATISVGYDHIDVKTAEEKGIKVINAGTGNICASTYSVAEFAFWLLLTLIRKSRHAFDAVEKNSPTWSELSEGGIIGEELFGKTLGIIGVGRIGSHVARVGRGFCMKVIGYDPYVNPERALQNGAKLVNSLGELLSNSDIVSINCCLTDETRTMIGKQEMSLMKDGIYIVNTARGEIIDEHVMLEGFKSGKIGGYATDVLTGEPPTEETSPILAAYRHKEKLNLLITPHIAWTSKEGIAERYPLLIGNRIKAELLGTTIEEWELLRYLGSNR
jgi:D-3-phosphoglycerate dehydrogenase